MSSHQILAVIHSFHVRAINIHADAGGFVIAAGAILGICAGLLWTAQGSLMLAYPTEGQKGKFIGIFWSIFNLGGVVGASVALGQNFHSKVHIAIARLRTDDLTWTIHRETPVSAQFFIEFTTLTQEFKLGTEPT